jgi:NAD+ kinase
MMKVAVYGRNFHHSCRGNVSMLFQRLEALGAGVILYRPFYEYLKNDVQLKPKVEGLFDGFSDLPADVDFLFSVGGDGTFLETLSIVRENPVPVVGLNTGRLGFLAYISQESLEESLDSLFNGRYDLEERSLLEVSAPGNVLTGLNLALNEVRIYKNSASLITIHVQVDNEFLCSYWADGLILSTPTGSTAYNLSVGGPIVVPEADVMVLSPIAPHNLTNRPLVLPGKAQLQFTVETREPGYQLALDSRSEEIPAEMKIGVARAAHPLRMVRIENISFFSTLRNKLMWGVDKRN